MSMVISFNDVFLAYSIMPTIVWSMIDEGVEAAVNIG